MQKWTENEIWKGYKKKYDIFWLIYVKFKTTKSNILSLESPYLQGIVTNQFFSSVPTFKDTNISDVKQATGNYKGVAWGFYFFNPATKNHLHSWVSIFQNFGDPPLIFTHQIDKAFSTQNGQYLSKPMIFILSHDQVGRDIYIKILTGALSMGEVVTNLGYSKLSDVQIRKIMQTIVLSTQKKMIIRGSNQSKIESVERFSAPTVSDGIKKQNIAYIDQWARVQGDMRSVGTIIKTVGKHDRLNQLLKKIRNYVGEKDIQNEGHPIWMITSLITPYATFFSAFYTVVLQQTEKIPQHGNIQIRRKATFSVQMLQFPRRIRLFNYYCVRMSKQISKQVLQGVLSQFQFLMGASSRIYQMMGGQNSTIGIQWQMIQRAIILAEALGQFLVLLENQGSSITTIHDRPGTWDNQGGGGASVLETQNFVTQAQQITKQALALGNMVDTEILVLSKEFSEFTISTQQQSNQYSRVVVVENQKQKIQAAQMSKLLQKNIPVATLVLIQHKIQRIQQLSKIIVAQVQLIKSGKIFRRSDNYNFIAINSSLLLSLSKQLSTQIGLLKVQSSPQDINKTKAPDFFVLLQGRLKLVTSSTLKICIQNNILRMANSQSTNINLELIKELNIKDQKELLLNFSLIAVILDSELSDKMKLEVLEIFQLSNNPYEDVVKKFGDKMNLFDEKAIKIMKQCKQHETIYMPAAKQYRYNPQKQKTLQKLVQKKKDLKQIMNSDIKDSSQVLSRQIQVFLPNYDRNQVKAASSLMNMRHKKILGVKQSDYILNCKQIGFSYGQIAQIQNSTQIPSTRALVKYNQSNALANSVGNHIEKWGIQQFQFMLQVQQQDVISRMKNIQSLLQKIYGRQQQMYSQVKEINQTTKQIKDLISNQLIIMTKQIHTLSKFPFSDEFRKAKKRFEYLKNSTTAIQIHLAKNSTDMINGFQQMLDKIDKMAQQGDKKQQITIQLVKQLQGSMNQVQLSSQAGIKQLSQILSLSFNQTKELIQSGFISGQAQRGQLANMIQSRSKQINSKIQQLANIYLSGNSQVKSACYHIFQGLYTIFTQFRIKSARDQQHFGTISSQVQAITKRISSIDEMLQKMTNNVEHIVQNYSQQLYNVIVQSNQQVTSGLSFLQTQAASISGQIQDNQVQLVEYLNQLANKITQESQNNGVNMSSNKIQSQRSHQITQMLVKQLGMDTYSGYTTMSNQLELYNQKIAQTIKSKQKLAKKSQKLRTKLIILLSTINKGQQLSQLSDDGLIQKVRTSLQHIVKNSDKVSKYTLHLRTFMTLLSIDADTVAEGEAQTAITEKIQALKMKGAKWEQQQQLSEGTKAQSQRNLANVAGQLNRLKQQIGQKQRLINELRGQISNLKSQMSSLTGRQGGLKSEIQQKRGKVQQLQRAMQNMRRINDQQLKTQLQLARNQHNQSLINIKSNNQSLIRLKNEQIEGIRRAIKEDQQKYELQVQKLKKQKAEALQQLKSQLDIYYKNLAEATATSNKQLISNRDKQLALKKNQIDALKQQRIQQLNRNQQLLTRIHNTVIQQKTKRLEQKDAQILALQQSIKDLQKKWEAQKNKQLQDKQSQIIKLSKKVESLEQKVADKTSQVQNQTNMQKIKQLSDQLSVATRSLNLLKSDTQRTINAQKALSTKLERQRDEVVAKLGSASQQAQNAKKAKSQIQNKLNSAETKLNNLNQQLNSKQAQHLRDIESAKRQGAQSKRFQIEDLKSRISTQQSRLNTLKSEKQQVQTKLNKAQQQVARLSTLSQSTEQRFRDLKNNHAEALERSRQQLVRSAAQVQELKDRIIAQTAQLKRQMTAGQQQLSRARKQLKQQKILLGSMQVQLQKQRGLVKSQKGMTQAAQLKVIQLEGQINLLKSKINHLQTQAQNIKQKATKLQGEFLKKQSQFTIERNNLKNDVQKKQTQLTQALARMVEVNKAKQIQQKKNQNQIIKLEGKITQLEQKNRGLLELVAEADSLKQHYDQILLFYKEYLTKNEYQILNSADQKLSKRRQKLLQYIQKNMQKKVELIGKLQLDVKAMKQNIDKQQKELGELRNKKASLQQHIQSLKLQAQERINTQSRLEGQISSLQTSKAQLQKNLDQSKRKVKQLQHQASENLKTISHLTQFKVQCQSLQKQNNIIKQAKSAVQIAFQQEKQRTLKSIQQLKQQTSIVQKLMTQKSSDKRFIEQMKSEFESLKNQLAKKDVDLKNLQTYKQNLTKQMSQVSQQSKSWRLIATRLRNMNNQLADAVHGVNDQIRVLQQRINSIHESGHVGSESAAVIFQYEAQIRNLKQTITIMQERAKITEINSAGGHKPLDETGLWSQSKSIKNFKKNKDKKNDKDKLGRQNKKKDGVQDLLNKLDEMDLNNSSVAEDFKESQKQYVRQSTKVPQTFGTSVGTQKSQIKLIRLLLQTLGTVVANIFQSIETMRKLINMATQIRERQKSDKFKQNILSGLIDAYMETEQKFVQLQRQTLLPFQQTAHTFFSQSTNQFVNYAYSQLRQYHHKTMAHKNTYKVADFQLLPQVKWFPDANDPQKIDFQKTQQVNFQNKSQMQGQNMQQQRKTNEFIQSSKKSQRSQRNNRSQLDISRISASKNDVKDFSYYSQQNRPREVPIVFTSPPVIPNYKQSRVNVNIGTSRRSDVRQGRVQVFQQFDQQQQDQGDQQEQYEQAQNQMDIESIVYPANVQNQNNSINESYYSTSSNPIFNRTQDLNKSQRSNFNKNK